MVPGRSGSSEGRLPISKTALDLSRQQEAGAVGRRLDREGSCAEALARFLSSGLDGHSPLLSLSQVFGVGFSLS